MSYPVPQPAPAPSAVPDAPSDRIPGLAIAAAVLGLLGCLPLGFMVLIALAFSTDGGSVDGRLAWLFLVPVLPLVGSILLLCRRGWWFFLVSCLPGTALLCWFLFQGGIDPSELFGLQGMLLFPLVALGCGLHPRVRRWVAARRRV